VGQGTNNGVAPVITTQQWGHGLQGPTIQNIQQKGFENVVCVVSQRNLIAPELNSSIIKNSPAQPRTKSASGLALRHIGLHDGIGILLEDAKWLFQSRQVFRQDLFWKPGLALVQI